MTRDVLIRRAVPVLLVASSLVVGVGAGRSAAKGEGMVAKSCAPFSARLLTCRRSPLIERRIAAVAARRRPSLTLPARQVKPSLRCPGYARYGVKVRNAGRSTARHVVVSASCPAHPASDGTRTIRRLRAGESVEVSFVAPKCAATDPAPP